MRPRLRRSALPLAILAALGTSHGDASAQILGGIVRDASNGAPVVGAIVSARNGPDVLVGTTVTAEDGTFRIALSEPGSYGLRVQALGYGRLDTELYIVMEGDAVDLDVRLQPEALDVPGVTVTVDAPRSGRYRFQVRRSEGRGIFLDPAHLANRNMLHPGDAFRGLDSLGVRVRWGGTTETSTANRIPEILTSKGNGCVQYLLNERPVFTRRPGTLGKNPWTFWPLSSVRPDDVMGIEIYRHLGEVPEAFRNFALIEHYNQFGRYDHDETCGLVIIWTKGRW